MHLGAGALRTPLDVLRFTKKLQELTEQGSRGKDL